MVSRDTDSGGDQFHYGGMGSEVKGDVRGCNLRGWFWGDADGGGDQLHYGGTGRGDVGSGGKEDEDVREENVLVEIE